MQPTDEAIVVRVRNGDADAFAVLVRRYERPVYAYAYSFLRDANEAEDAAEEAFVRAFASLANLTDASKFYPWLRGIARHVCQHWRAKQSRRPASLHANTAALDRVDDAPSPAASAETAEFEASVSEMMASLPETYATVAQLRFKRQMKVGAIATELSLSVEAVESRLRRAKDMLREKMLQRFPHLRETYGL